MRSFLPFFLLLLLSLAPARARADDLPHDVHAYYAGETTTGLLFTAFGGVTAAAGGAALTQGGDFAKGLGLSTLVLGGVTFVGGLAYVLAVKYRGGYFEHLAATDPARFKREEGARVAGTNKRMWLYLGTELAIAAVGAGLATYGIAANKPLATGLGVGGAVEGIGYFVIDTPGKQRAATYADEVVMARARPVSLTLTQNF